MTAPTRLAAAEIRLLLEVLATRAPHLVPKVSTGAFDRAERSSICEALGAELCETGLDCNGEPNQRGLQLERLLDTINRPNLLE